MNVLADIPILLHWLRKLEKLAVTNVVEQFHSGGSLFPLLRDGGKGSGQPQRWFPVQAISKNGYYAYKCVDTADYILSYIIKKRPRINSESLSDY